MPPMPSAAKLAGCTLRRELLLALQVRHEEAAALVREAEVVDAQHAQAEAHLRADRVERRVERFLGDAEVGDAHRHDAALAPDEERERRLHRRDLERAASSPARSTAASCALGRMHERLRAPRAAAGCRARPASRILIGKLELIGRVDLGVELDRLDRRALEAQRLDRSPPSPPAAWTCSVRVSESRVVLQRDHAQHVRCPDRSARARLQQLGRSRKSAHRKGTCC